MRNLFFVAGVALLTGCIISSPSYSFAGGKNGAKGKSTFTITGDIANMPEQIVVLELLRANDSIRVVDSQRSKPGGHFEITGTTTQAGLYRLHFSAEHYILLSLEKGSNKITATWPGIDAYSIEGEAPSVMLKYFIDSIRARITNINTKGAKFDSIKATGNQGLIMAGEKDIKDQQAAFVTYLKDYSLNTPYEPNAILAARMVNPKEDGAYLESFSKTMEKKFPATQLTKDLKEYSAKIKESMPASTEPGSKAPELKLEDLNGKTVSLSSMQGKYVLIDFWASWCGPCRGENPNVVAAYKKYKDRNFTILGVSLDNNKEKWQKAVNDDGLVWTQISDLKGWSSGAAAKYGVQSIPSNFLVDPKGIIIARNLRGPQLESKLDEVLK